MTSYLKTVQGYTQYQGIHSISVIFVFGTLFWYRNHKNILYILKFWVPVDFPWTMLENKLICAKMVPLKKTTFSGTYQETFVEKFATRTRGSKNYRLAENF